MKLICLLCCAVIFGTKAQEYIVPQYVRADEFGTAYFRAAQPKIGPTKSKFHIENLIKLENELIGLGEIILETEAKLHEKEQNARIEKSQKLQQKLRSKDKRLTKPGKSAESAENFFDIDFDFDDDEHHPHDYSKETA